MTNDYRKASLEVLAVFAWADGIVDERERVRVADFIATTSGAPTSEIATIIASNRSLSNELLDRVRQMPAAEICQLLAFADAMCNASRPATASELSLMRSLCVARFGEIEWPHVSAWLEHQRKANELLDALLDERSASL
jgi:hypothetical protein